MFIYVVKCEHILDGCEEVIAVCGNNNIAIEKIQTKLLESSIAWRYYKFTIDVWNLNGDIHHFELFNKDQNKEMLIAAGGTPE